MDIVCNAKDDRLEISLNGRLDTITTPQFETAIRGNLSGVRELSLDFKNLEYISSAGLRVLLTTQKTMSRQGSMEVLNVNDTIMDVFEMTGFIDILTIK